MSGRSGKHKRRKKKVDCPDIEQPLCTRVALWGMQTSRLLTQETVSREFLIPQKVAEDILRYIDHEGRVHISSRRFIQNDRAKGRRFALRILDVLPPPKILVNTMKSLDFMPKITTPAVKRPLSTLTNFQRLRQWMLSRKHNEQVPPELLMGDE